MRNKYYKTTGRGFDTSCVHIFIYFLPLSQGMPARCWFCQDNPSSLFELYHSGICNIFNKINSWFETKATKLKQTEKLRWLQYSIHFLSLPNFLLIFQRIKKIFYSKHPYIQHLESTTVNILPDILYHISIHPHPLIFN